MVTSAARRGLDPDMLLTQFVLFTGAYRNAHVDVVTSSVIFTRHFQTL